MNDQTSEMESESQRESRMVGELKLALYQVACGIIMSEKKGVNKSVLHTDIFEKTNSLLRPQVEEIYMYTKINPETLKVLLSDWAVNFSEEKVRIPLKELVDSLFWAKSF